MNQLSRDQPSALTFQQKEAELRASQEEEQRKLQVGAPVHAPRYHAAPHEMAATAPLSFSFQQLYCCSHGQRSEVMVRGRGQWQEQLSSVRALMFQVEGEGLMHSTAVAPPPHVFFLLSGGAGGVREAAWRSQDQETGEEGGGG